MLKAAIVGMGGISGAHIPGWRSAEGVELVAVCDVREERMENCKDLHCYTDFEEMLDKEKPDILDICLPTFLHTKFALAAMKRGIHVLCEKPVSLETDDVDLLYRTAEENGVKFMVAQVLRFWPEYRLLKEIYDTGRYGKLLSGEMERLEAHPGWSWDSWMIDEKRSGAVPFDLHIHDLDFMVYTFGKPEDVHHFRSHRPDQDYVHAVYTYPDFQITSEAAWYGGCYPFRASFRFQFENAVVAYENGKLSIYLKGGEVITPFDQPSAQFGEIPTGDAYANEIHYFAECVRLNREQTTVRQEELRTVLEILNGLN